MKNKLIVFLSCISILLCSSGTTIYALQETYVENNFQTSIVDIELDEYQLKDGKEVLWKNKPTVLPGTNISKIPRITNNGTDCYIRAKITFENEFNITEDDIYGISKDWIKAEDGYYYYKNIVKNNEEIDFFKGLIIPNDFVQESEGSEFSLKVDVNAIQSKNFTPNFNSKEPWGAIEILECEKEGEYDISTFKTIDNQSLEVIYQNTKKLITNEDDFFTNFPILLPGDVYSDSVTINNSSSNDIDLYFRTETIDDSELLEKITLKITKLINDKEEVVYEGPLKANSLNENLLLGKINKTTKNCKFNFTISVPTELNNQYTILSSKVKWIFSTTPYEEIEQSNNESLENSEPIVQTGDTNGENLKILSLLFISSGICLGLFTICLKKEFKEENKK